MATRTDESFSLVLLVHNEADSVEEELRTFRKVVADKLPGLDFIVAEDGSTDGSREKLVALEKELGFRIVGGAERKGYARAWGDAIRATNTDWVCICDGGLKHEPSDFWKLYDARVGADVVVGRKTNRTDQIYRRVLTIGFNAMLRMVFDVDVHDADSGLRMLSRRVVDDIVRSKLKFRGFVSTETAVRAVKSGLTYREVPIAYRQRSGPSRALPLKRIPKAIRHVLEDVRDLKSELS